MSRQHVRNDGWRRLLGVIAVAAPLLVAPVCLGTAIDEAEYAVRWNPAEGGPKSAKQVLELLGTTADDKDEYTVRYFEVAAPAGAPAGFKAILRQRQKKNKYELKFKYRGPDSLPGDWTCPLSADPAEREAEVDVSFLAEGVKSVHAYSCSVESVGAPIPPPAALGAVPATCVNTMKRIEAGTYKIEEWKLPGDVTMIEVSRKGALSDTERDEFRQTVVEKLLDKGIKPSDRSKTELGASCPTES